MLSGLLGGISGSVCVLVAMYLYATHGWLVAMWPPLVVLAFFAGSFWQFCIDHPQESEEEDVSC